MPDIITHILFAEDMLKRVEKWSDSKWKKDILNRKELFILGCQGPDIFFYNDFLPWIRNKRGPKIGTLMHLEKTGDFFIEGVKYIKENKTKDNEALFTYLSGFMCHFALDKITHPYIFYFTGEYDKARPETVQYKGYHKKLELIIDTILLKEKKGLKSCKYNIYKKIDAGKTLPKSVNEFYDYAFEKIYKLRVDEGLANNSYKDIKKVFKLIYDPVGIKKGTLHTLDVLTNDKLKYSNLTHPRKIDDEVDYMNKNHNKWVHPCDEKDIYEDSFYDLYEKAYKEGENMILSSLEYLEGNESLKNIRNIFPNVTYSTGKEKNECNRQKYFKSIFIR